MARAIISWAARQWPRGDCRSFPGCHWPTRHPSAVWRLSQWVGFPIAAIVLLPKCCLGWRKTPRCRVVRPEGTMPFLHKSTSCRRACAPNSIPCVRLSVLSTAELTVFVARAWPRYRDHHEIRCTYAANQASCSHAQSRKVRDIHHLHLQLSTPCIGRLMGLLGTQGGLVGNASVCAMRRRGTHVINDPSRDISTHRPTWGPPTVFYLRPHHSLARTMMHDRMPRNEHIVLACIGVNPGVQRSAFSFLRHDGYRVDLCIVRLESCLWINDSHKSYFKSSLPGNI